MANPIANNDFHEIDLWRWSLDTSNSDEELRASLAPDELDRASRFVKAHDTRRYMVGRSVMRRILGQYVGAAAHDIAFHYNGFGKPQLLQHSLTPIQFNLSHSAGQALLAVSTDFVVGVDLEEIRPISDDVARHFFSPEEYAELQSYQPREQLHAFYRCWTRKEAFVKAHGTGLSLKLDDFDVSLSAHSENILTRLDLSLGNRQDWTILNIALQGDFCAAVAVQSFGKAIRLRYRGEGRDEPNIASMT